SFFDLTALDKRNKPFDIAALKGSVVVVVNVASKCGFTPQYKGLETLYQKYKDQGLVILGFPCNQFASQEPGSAEDAASACQLNFGVTFP
ncbi:thioredoxin-like protein, partial [Blyttiomyces helicus]